MVVVSHGKAVLEESSTTQIEGGEIGSSLPSRSLRINPRGALRKPRTKITDLKTADPKSAIMSMNQDWKKVSSNLTINKEIGGGGCGLKVEASTASIVSNSSSSLCLIQKFLSKLVALAIVGSVCWGLYLECVEWENEEKWDSHFVFHFWKFTFYTIQSNTLVALYYLSSLVRGSDRRTFGDLVLKSCSLMMISITMVIWHVILSTSVNTLDYVSWKARWGSYTLHTIVPGLCWFDWLFIDKLIPHPYQLRKRCIPLYLICPLSYLAFSLIRAKLGGPYGISHITGKPIWHWYPFIEISNPMPIFPGASKLGIDNPALIVTLNCVLIAIVIIFSGFLFIALDRRLRFQK